MLSPSQGPTLSVSDLGNLAVLPGEVDCLTGAGADAADVAVWPG